MNPRVHKQVIWWLLPLFALRGLVPAGFMLDTSQGELSIIVCPGHATQSQSGNHDAPSGKQDATVCPFAAATSAGPLANAVPFGAADVQPDQFNLVDLADSELPFGPARAQQSRAPPHFS